MVYTTITTMRCEVIIAICIALIVIAATSYFMEWYSNKYW